MGRGSRRGRRVLRRGLRPRRSPSTSVQRRGRARLRWEQRKRRASVCGELLRRRWMGCSPKSRLLLAYQWASERTTTSSLGAFFNAEKMCMSFPYTPSLLLFPQSRNCQSWSQTIHIQDYFRHTLVSHWLSCMDIAWIQYP